MRQTLLPLLFGAVFGLITVSSAIAEQLIAYPNQDEALFVISIPDDWEITQAESTKEFFLVEGPTGAALFFRAMPGEIETTIEENFAYLEENFDDLRLSELEEVEGDEFATLVANGTGVDPEDGSNVIFGMAWFAFPDGSVAEIWFEAAADDQKGAAQAKAILESFSPVE